MSNADSGAPRNVIPAAPQVPVSPPEKCHTYHTPKPSWWKRLSSWQFFFEILIFLVTVRIAFIYSGQLDAMLKANGINKQAADAAESAAKTAQGTLVEIRNENRAWVYVKSMKVNKIEAGRRVEVDVGFSNFGHSPALDTQITAKLHITNDPRVVLPALGHVEGNKPSILLVPAGETHLLTYTANLLSADDVERVKRPDASFYVYGVGTYRDTSVTRALHHFEYCVVFTPYNSEIPIPCVGKQYDNTSD